MEYSKATREEPPLHLETRWSTQSAAHSTPPQTHSIILARHLSIDQTKSTGVRMLGNPVDYPFIFSRIRCGSVLLDASGSHGVANERRVSYLFASNKTGCESRSPGVSGSDRVRHAEIRNVLR